MRTIVGEGLSRMDVDGWRVLVIIPDGTRKPFVAGMQVWNFADSAAVQGTNRVGGMNLKGVFTRARQPKLVAHVLRELWAANRAPAV